MASAQHDIRDNILLTVRRAAAMDNTTLSAYLDGSDQAELRRKLIKGVRFSSRLILTYHAALCAVVLAFTMCKKTLPKRPGSLWQYLRAVRALGMYQPPPIPCLNKALPSNSTSLFILLLLGINVFYATYNIQWTLELAFVFSDRTALLFVANLPWLYLLAAKNQPVRLLTGYSYENLNILHRRPGEIMCLLAIIHGAGMIAAWYCFFRPTGMTIWHFLSLPMIVLGLSALACYELLYLTSLASFRQWWYEVFLGSHIALQAAGLVLVFFHHRNGRIYVGIALAIFLLDRLLFRLVVKSRSTRADLTVMEDGETVLVSADWPLADRWRNVLTALLGLDVRYGWTTTEHVFLTVPALARKHIVQAHPFTIASAAPARDHAWLNIIARAHDGFTRDLLHYARAHASATLRLDGPYGSLHSLHMLQSSDIALVVVGGSGIAVAYPLIWALLHEHDAEVLRTRRRVCLIWVIHEASHVSWIGHERLDELRGRGLHIVIPAPTSKAGRPDVPALSENTISEMMDGSQDSRIGVVVSGPDSMNRAVRNRCASIAWRDIDVHVAVEKYGW
ncbi:hypothetical protein B0A55_04576 [Friedmanniomyces simplex]|uniref:FAD-binding FR-type domain-containing protein n=1 Tax=Friedmanniomyces simplex TaxID=329884 RepID=A0A4U0XHD5_9PEZI|nr:hypothetical protein B0A55_04576 [Friedmanniomyces simplex]